MLDRPLVWTTTIQINFFTVNCSGPMIAFDGFPSHKVVIGANKNVNRFSVVEVVCKIQAFQMDIVSYIELFCLVKESRSQGNLTQTFPFSLDFVFVNTVLQHYNSVSGNLHV